MRRVSSGGLLGLLLVTSSCGKPVLVTVTVERAALLADASAGAPAVGEVLPGKAVEAKVPGLLGTKGFYAVVVDGKRRYLSEAQAAPVPLPSEKMFVQADRAELCTDRALTRPAATLGLGAEVQIYRPGSDEKALAVLEGGFLRGFLRGDAAVAAEAAGTLGAKVVEAARAGDVALASARAEALRGFELGPAVQALARALQPSSAPERRGGEDEDAPAPLRTGSPPKAGARAYVATFTLPVFGLDTMMPQRPVMTLDLGQAVDVRDLRSDLARIVPLGPGAAGESPPPFQVPRPTREETLYVDARALQLEAPVAEDLHREAEARGARGESEERLELLARALLLSGATEKGFQELFDDAMSAGSGRWAAWAAGRGRTTQLVVWGAVRDAKKAQAEADALSKVTAALAPAATIGAVAIRGRDVPGADPETQLVVAGACREGETVSPELVALLAKLRPGSTPTVQRVRLTGEALALACPDFVWAGTDNCERPVYWKSSGDASVSSGGRTLVGVQLAYRNETCGDWYEVEQGVLAAFFLLDKAGRPLAVETVRPETQRSNLEAVVSELETAMQASGKGLVAVHHEGAERCGPDEGEWVVTRKGVQASIQGNEIGLVELPSRVAKKGECSDPGAAQGD